MKNTKCVHSVTLIDPVCFRIYDSMLAYQFVYRIPSKANEYLIHWVVSRELYISHFICRHFVWHLNTLFPEELPTKAHVFVSEKDNLIDGRCVYKYLKQHKVNVTLFEKMDHAQFVIQGQKEDDIVKHVNLMLPKSKFKM